MTGYETFHDRMLSDGNNRTEKGRVIGIRTVRHLSIASQVFLSRFYKTHSHTRLRTEASEREETICVAQF